MVLKDTSIKVRVYLFFSLCPFFHPLLLEFTDFHPAWVCPLASKFTYTIKTQAI